MVEELPTCTNTPRQSSVEACPCRQATLDNVAHLLTVKYLQITWNIQCERHEDLVSRIIYELPAWGAIGFLSVELKNRIDSVFKRLKRFGYINCTVIINDLIDRSDYELFRKVCYTIYPSIICHAAISYKWFACVYGHPFQLPECAILTCIADILLSDLLNNSLVRLFYCSYYVFYSYIGSFYVS